MKLVLVLVIALISCLSVKETAEEPIDPRLQRFVDAFLTDCTARRKDCVQALARIDSIKVVDRLPDFVQKEDAEVIGRCYISFRRRRIEVIKETLFQPDRYMRALIYHEIGHCAYDLEHVPEDDVLMAEHMPGMPALVFKWKELLDGFFAEIAKKNDD